MKEYPDVLTADDLAEMMGLNIQTIQLMCREGSIPAYKIKSKWLCSKQAFLDWTYDRSMENIGRVKRATGTDLRIIAREED